MKGAFLLDLKTMLLVLVMAMFWGFAIAFWMKYPRQWLKWAYLKLRRMNPKPYVKITRNGGMDFDIAPYSKFIEENGDSGGKRAYWNIGEGLNLFGFGAGNVYYENYTIPLDLTPKNLEEKIRKYIDDLSDKCGVVKEVVFRAIKPEEMENIWTSWGLRVYQIFKAKAERSIKMATILTLGIAALTLVLMLFIYYRQNQIATILVQLVNLAQSHTHTGIITNTTGAMG